jgi:predicted porin
MATSLLASPVLAADSFQISGTLDLGIYKDFDGNDKVGSISRSNIAFTAQKDLTAGLALTAKLNTRIWLRNPNTGQYLVNEDPKYLGAAETTVGLKGDWGHLRAGRALTALWQNDWAYDAWYNYDAIASPAWQTWHGNSPADPNGSQTGASFARLNNGLFYSSPAWNGLSFDASYGMKQRSADQTHSKSLALKYARGNFGGMVAHEKTPAGNAVTFLGASVKLGPVQLNAGYDDEKLSTGTRNRSYALSARYTRGDWSYMAGLGIQRDYDNAEFFGLGLSYAYRPNLSVYASYGHRASGFWGSTSASDAFGVGLSFSF